MNFIRLGDRLIGSSKSNPRNIRFLNGEFIAQAVFNPLPDQDSISTWFIQSLPLDETGAFKNIIRSDEPVLGQYEVKLIDKILNPQRPVLAIVGPMGSGKTTVKNFTALNLVKYREHCGKCDRTSNRLIAQINFDDHIYLNDLSSLALSNKFNSILCEELICRINYDIVLEQHEELVKFWNYELDRYYNHKSSSLAFRKIAAGLKYRKGAMELTESEFDEREKVRKAIERNKDAYLDYLIRFWSYLIRFKFCGNSGCGYIVLDNVDRVDIVVQRKILQIIHTYAKLYGPTFLIILRPETFDYMGLGTGIIDVESHVSPKVIDIVKQRLNLFCKNPDRFFEEGRGVSLEQFEIIKTYMANVNKEISSDKHQNFQNFVENSCGRSIRNGLIMMQSLFYASKADMTNSNLSNRDLVRICIRAGADQMIWSPNHQINHIFRVANHNGDSLLVKPRILRYLGRHEKGKRRLNEIINTLLGFDYDDNLIIGALNDLMRINSQLIRSNGFNQYEEDALRKYSGNTIILTEVGKGYSNYLINNIDYLQEVMLDTYVDGDNFPQEIGYGYLVDKFKLLYLFLNELRRVDIEETQRFLDRWSEKAYKEAFGEHLISLDIIHGIYQPVIGILDSEKRDRYEIDELIEYFQSLVMNVEADNQHMLDVEIVSILPRR